MRKNIAMQTMALIAALLFIIPICSAQEDEAKTADIMQVDEVLRVQVNEVKTVNLMPKFDETMANQSRIGEFVIFEFDNPSKNILGFNHETKELSVSANNNRGAICELPEELFKNAAGNTPEKWWQFSMTIRMVLDTEDEWARLLDSGVTFLDGNGLFGTFRATYWNRIMSGVLLQVYNNSTIDIDAIGTPYILGPFENNIYPDKPTEEERADMMRIYDWMTTKVKLTFRVTSDGTATIIYGNDWRTMKMNDYGINDFDITTGKPAFKVLGFFNDAGNNVTYISDVTFSCE